LLKNAVMAATNLNRRYVGGGAYQIQTRPLRIPTNYSILLRYFPTKGIKIQIKNKKIQIKINGGTPFPFRSCKPRENEEEKEERKIEWDLCTAKRGTGIT